MENKDCFAYDKKNHDCMILTKLYCKRGKCNFYKTVEQYEQGTAQNTQRCGISKY